MDFVIFLTKDLKIILLTKRIFVLFYSLKKFEYTKRIFVRIVVKLLTNFVVKLLTIYTRQWAFPITDYDLRSVYNQSDCIQSENGSTSFYHRSDRLVKYQSCIKQDTRLV